MPVTKPATLPPASPMATLRLVVHIEGEGPSSSGSLERAAAVAEGAAVGGPARVAVPGAAADGVDGVRSGGDGGVTSLVIGTVTPGASGWNDHSPAGRLDLASPDGFSAFGHSVASAGDIDGDGFADFVIGADAANGAAGTAHLYLGSATPTTADWNGDSPAGRIDLTNPDGTTASFGYSVAGAGDVNGDGYADFLITALSANSNSGVAHLYFGQPEPSTDKWNGLSAAGRADLTNIDGDREP